VEENDNTRKQQPSVYSKTIRAGRRRTYFFDVRTTRSNDYYITITESKKRFNEDGYDRHKVFLYKEDFNKFFEALQGTIDHVKTELLPEYDFDEFNHEYDDAKHGGGFKNESLESAISSTDETKEDTKEETKEEVVEETAEVKEEATDEAEAVETSEEPTDDKAEPEKEEAPEGEAEEAPKEEEPSEEDLKW